MKNLYKYIPGFAADYSGACNVLYEMGGLCVIHDGGACVGHTVMTDEVRWGIEKSHIFSSALKEVEAVTGDDDRLVKKLIHSANAANPKFIAIMGTPAPTIMGTDFEGIAKIVERKTGVPALGISTNGFQYYQDGVSRVYMSLIKKFICKDTCISPETAEVNILGTTVIDMWDVESVQCLEQLIKDCGAGSVAGWGTTASLEQIAGADKSRLNVVVSISGLKAAKYMQKHYGVPYIAGFPIGRRETRTFQQSIAECLGEKKMFPEESVSQKSCGKEKILIIGEQIFANSLRACLENEYQAKRVDIVSHFGLDKEYKRAGDGKIADEDDLVSFVRENGPYDLVIGDPVFQEILQHEKEKIGEFLEWPHMAVSSLLYMSQCFNYVSETGSRFLDYVFKMDK